MLRPPNVFFSKETREHTELTVDKEQMRVKASDGILVFKKKNIIEKC